MDLFGGGGRGPPTRALFGENACENERIKGGVHRKILNVDPPMHDKLHTLKRHAK